MYVHVILFMFIYGLLLTYTIGPISISGHGETNALKLYIVELVEVSTILPSVTLTTCIKINQGQKLCSQAVKEGAQSLRTGSDGEAQGKVTAVIDAKSGEGASLKDYTRELRKSRFLKGLCVPSPPDGTLYSSQDLVLRLHK